MQDHVSLDLGKVKKAARVCLKALGHEKASLSILLVDDRKMREIHSRWLGSRRTTDVLSFPQEAVARGVPVVLGDVVISAQTAARRVPRNALGEVGRYLVHGILHLSGRDHQRPQDRRRMRLESARLEKLIAGGLRR